MSDYEPTDAEIDALADWLTGPDAPRFAAAPESENKENLDRVICPHCGPAWALVAELAALNCVARWPGRCGECLPCRAKRLVEGRGR